MAAKNSLRASIESNDWVHTVRRSLLVALFHQHQAFFSHHGFKVDDPEVHQQLWRVRLQGILNAPKVEIPAELETAIIEILALAHDRAQVEFMALAKDRHLNLGDDPEQLCAGDLAIWFYVFERSLFMRTYMRMAMQKAGRALVFADTTGNPQPFAVSETATAVFEKRAGAYWESLKRTKFIEVFVIEEGPILAFYIARGDAPRSFRIINTKTLRRRQFSFIPTQHDVIRYDLRTGELSISSHHARDSRFYAMLVGEIFRGDARYFQEQRRFTLAPIIHDCHAALSVEGIPELESVRLKSARFASNDKENDLRTTLSAEHLELRFPEVLGNAELKKLDRCDAVTLGFRVVGKGEFEVEVGLPNRIKMDPRIADLVYLFLRRRTFILTVLREV